MELWSKIKQVVKKAADAVEDFINAVGNVVGNAVEAIGDGVNDGLNWIGDKVGGKPLFSWLGGIVKNIFSIVGVAIKGVFGIVGGMLGGLIKIIGGTFTLQTGLILNGFGDIFSSIFGTLIVVAGKIVALVQSILYLQGFERPLTENEKSELKKVFNDSLNYYVIRIIEGHAALFGPSPRPFTLSNTIYMKTDTFLINLLVHETTHIWQHQQDNNRYASDAVSAQWFVFDEYNWEREIKDRNKTSWIEFNSEAQAQFIQDLWKLGELVDGAGRIIQTGKGAFFNADAEKTFGHFEVNGVDYTSIATDAVKTLRKEYF